MAPVTPKLRYQVLRRDNFTCRYCGARAPDVRLHVDHIYPGSLGGPTTPSNLVTACQPCNQSKASAPLQTAALEPAALAALLYRLCEYQRRVRAVSDVVVRCADGATTTEDFVERIQAYVADLDRLAARNLNFAISPYQDEPEWEDEPAEPPEAEASING